MQKVYVVFMSTDYEKENEAEVLGVYLSKDKALRELQKFAEEYSSDGKIIEITGGHGIFLNVPTNDGGRFFEIVEMNITED